MTRVCAALLCAFSVGLLRAEPLDVMLVIEASPGTEYIHGSIRAKAFEQGDRVGVVAFYQRSDVVQPLTSDRKTIDDALRYASSRIGGAVGPGNGVPYNINMSTDLSSALHQAFNEFHDGEAAGRKRIVIVWFGSDDLGLGRRLESLRAAARNAEARLYAIALQRALTQPSPFGSPRVQASYPFPTTTVHVLAQLVEDVGGHLYKTNWSLKEILKSAR